mmetsp:Transcript_23884/g.34937  ORF Transcript_23884/g.34937 Transcript_23884/m.34937 type:complete len:213 (-) Transcript_23884:340-978(-)
MMAVFEPSGAPSVSKKIPSTLESFMAAVSPPIMFVEPLGDSFSANATAEAMFSSVTGCTPGCHCDALDENWMMLNSWSSDKCIRIWSFSCCCTKAILEMGVPSGPGNVVDMDPEVSITKARRLTTLVLPNVHPYGVASLTILLASSLYKKPSNLSTYRAELLPRSNEIFTMALRISMRVFWLELSSNNVAPSVHAKPKVCGPSAVMAPSSTS